MRPALLTAAAPPQTASFRGDSAAAAKAASPLQPVPVGIPQCCEPACGQPPESHRPAALPLLPQDLKNRHPSQTRPSFQRANQAVELNHSSGSAPGSPPG